MFTAATNGGARAAGSPVTFARHRMGATRAMFGYSDTSQPVINTVVTFVMVFLIQSTQNRDGAAIHAKLERGARGYPCVNANFD